MQRNNNISTKLGMIDIGSKLCIKYPHLEKVPDILHYFFRFYYYNNQESIVNKLKIYDYYELNKNEEYNDIVLSFITQMSNCGVSNVETIFQIIEN